jgi:hypothetical protein
MRNPNLHQHRPGHAALVKYLIAQGVLASAQGADPKKATLAESWNLGSLRTLRRRWKSSWRHTKIWTRGGNSRAKFALVLRACTTPLRELKCMFSLSDATGSLNALES